VGLYGKRPPSIAIAFAKLQKMTDWKPTRSPNELAMKVRSERTILPMATSPKSNETKIKQLVINNIRPG
jgi:hypothetical protein